MSVYEYSAKAMNGRDISLENYRGKVVLIVNTASQCGFTFQYEDLQRLYDRYKEKGFVILGFPSNQFADQEPDGNDQINAFCTLNYGVSFPMFQKVDVRDRNAHPLFTYLANSKPFEGFDTTHSVAKILLPLLHERHPEYLPGDSIKWNFTKFLIDRDGQVIRRFESTTDPFDMEQDIEALL
ncbi:glutathione peroxidase [Paenibacillus hunanensis]|uniref:Glutathione peroxidase n=1 Tax=Paenibacillus hunanensis TaxID=539262 RepID=A0ABU1J1H6_9BACL|nr:glutathione peroxidase [Paenibacillus hunanensis]MCL9661517.1 glutathione peroxidase [Paenibacillus hunanensis]MDR6244822.1 glutathione peroxidase [Paenibacillus hunanensis]GGJ04367.1 glutathione peroxidase [Paenibacillus hunanensis]